MSFSTDGLREYGFVGFVPFRTWDKSMIGPTDVEGVYAITRTGPTPLFLDDSGRKPRRKAWSRDAAAARWVPDSEIVYIGKAPLRKNQRDGVGKRLHEFQRHGYRSGTSHYGGRLLWQLADSSELLAAWKTVPVGSASAIESGLIRGFEAEFGQRPYANVAAPLRASKAILI